MEEIRRMDTEELVENAKNLEVEDHLLLSGWVYGFTDQAHRKIHDLLEEERCCRLIFPVPSSFIPILPQLQKAALQLEQQDRQPLRTWMFI